jgi:hypothetical protein
LIPETKQADQALVTGLKKPNVFQRQRGGFLGPLALSGMTVPTNGGGMATPFSALKTIQIEVSDPHIGIQGSECPPPRRKALCGIHLTSPLPIPQ